MAWQTYNVNTGVQTTHTGNTASSPVASSVNVGGGGGGGGAITPTNLYNITTGESTTGVITQAMSDAGWVIGSAPTGTNNAPIVSSSGTSGAGYADTANLIGLGGETGWASSASPTIAFPKVEPVAKIAPVDPLAPVTPKASEQALGLQAALDRIEANNAQGDDQANVDYAKGNGGVATMVSADGTKTVQVAVGSQRASDLFGQGYTLGNKKGGGTMTADELAGSQIGANVNAVPGDDIVGDSAATIEKEKAIANIDAKLKLIEDTKTEMQKKNDDFTQTMLDAIGETAGKSEFESQQDALLVDPLEAELTSVKNQLIAVEDNKNRLLADIQGKPITMNSIIGSQAQVRAVLNAEIFTLTSKANMLLNNIEQAEKNVQDAVKAKYGVIEERIAIAQAQRNAIRDIVTRDEKAQLDALDAIDAEKKQAIADAKAKEINEGNLKLQQASVEALANQVRAGRLKLTNVPSELRGAVSVALGNAPTTNGGSNAPTQSQSSTARREGDVYEENGKYYAIGVDGNRRAATTEEINELKTGLNSEESSFEKLLIAEKKKLAKGGDWGKSWNFLHNLYPDATNDQLDAMLEKDKYYNN